MIRNRANLHAAIAGLAVEQFRVTHDRWPTDLAEVESALGMKLPDDPFTGEPLRYHATDTGVILYSIGDNFTDDGGHGASGSPPDAGRGRTIVFELRHARHRNVESDASDDDSLQND